MRRAFLVVALAAVVAVALAGTLHSERRAFTLGVTSTGVAVKLKPTEQVCQTGISVPRGGAFNAVRFPVGTYGRSSGPELAVTIGASNGETLAHGRLVSGYPDVTREGSHTVPVSSVADRRRIDVCVTNRGRRAVALYGAAAVSTPSIARDARGHALPTDLDLIFVRRVGISQLGLLPNMLRRAALFGGNVVVWWLVLVLVIVVVPSALWFACRTVERDPY